jgi:hypothetical protein
MTEVFAQEVTDNNDINSSNTTTVYYEDGFAVRYFPNGTEFHFGTGLNPTGDVPAKPQNTYFYPNGTSTADGVYVISHQCFEDLSCITC